MNTTTTRDAKGRFIKAPVIAPVQDAAEAAAAAFFEEDGGGTIGKDSLILEATSSHICPVCGAISGEVLCGKCSPHWVPDHNGHFGVRQKYRTDGLPGFSYPKFPRCPFKKEFLFTYAKTDFIPDSYWPSPRFTLPIPAFDSNVSLSSPDALVRAFERVAWNIYCNKRTADEKFCACMNNEEIKALASIIAPIFSRRGADIVRGAIKDYAKHFNDPVRIGRYKYQNGERGDPFTITQNRMADIAKVVKEDVKFYPAMDWIFQREWDALPYYLVNQSSCWWDGGNRGQSRCVAKAAGAFTVLDRTGRLRMVILPIKITETQDDGAAIKSVPVYDQETGLYETPDAFVIYNAYTNTPSQMFPRASDHDTRSYGVSSPNLAQCAQIFGNALSLKSGTPASARMSSFQINRKGYNSYVNSGYGGVVSVTRDISSAECVICDVKGECHNHND